MPDLQGQEGELRMVVDIKRAATGKTERVELVGHATPEARKMRTERAKGKPADDNVRKVDQRKVTSTVTLSGKETTRTYSDGAVQRLKHKTAKLAKDYAASVRQLEGKR